MKAMKREFNAVFENGILRPLEPVHFSERQRVVLTVNEEDSIPVAESKARTYSPRSDEQAWLRQHGNEYLDEWVVLEGDRLVSHGPDAKAVIEEARAAGITRPFLIQVTGPDELPWGGW